MRIYLYALTAGIVVDAATTYIGTCIASAYEQDGASIVLAATVAGISP